MERSVSGVVVTDEMVETAAREYLRCAYHREHHEEACDDPSEWQVARMRAALESVADRVCADAVKAALDEARDEWSYGPKDSGFISADIFPTREAAEAARADTERGGWVLGPVLHRRVTPWRPDERAR